MITIQATSPDFSYKGKKADFTKGDFFDGCTIDTATHCFEIYIGGPRHFFITK